jgi:hypothetical protein
MKNTILIGTLSFKYSKTLKQNFYIFTHLINAILFNNFHSYQKGRHALLFYL